MVQNIQRYSGTTPITQPKWYKADKDLQEKDFVYFQKEESALSSPWIMGVIDQVVRGRDGIIRRVIVRYRNFKEEFDRFTDRSV